MKKINLLLLSASVFAALLFGGCKDNKSVDNPGPQIAFAGGVNAVTLAQDSTSFILSATITSTANLASVTIYQVTDDAGDVQIGKTYTTFDTKTSFNLNLKMQSIVDAMLLKVSVTDVDNITVTKLFNVSVTSSGTTISANTKVLFYTASYAPVLGGQESGLPFGFSLSTGKVYSLKNQLTNTSLIDFLYYVDPATGGGGAEIISPKLAYDNESTFKLGTSSYTSANQTLLKIVPQVATIAYGNAVGSAGACVVTTSAGATWNAQTSGSSNILYSVYFNDINIGYAVGANGTILKTYNYGATWIVPYVTAPTTNDLNGVFFVGGEVGYAVGGNSITPVGTILKTVNGGITWTDYSTGSNNLNAVYFLDVNTGFAVGTGGTILATVDGGITWTKQTSTTTQNLNGVYFIDSNNGYAVGYNGVILKTTNAGATWTALGGLSTWTTSSPGPHLRSVFFTDASNGYVVGDGGIIIKTLNGGTSWTAKTSKVTTNLRSVFFTDANTGYVVGDFLLGGVGNIVTTVDGGSTWVPAAVGTTNFKSVRFLTMNRYTTTALFDAITSTDDSPILAIASPTPTTQVPNPAPYLSAGDLRVTGLAVNSIFAFKTAAGKYGLAKVKSVTNSEVGTAAGATTGTISFEIKVQR
jgi:photosystem II stability/assembly factor-like uncharacterized protein